MMINVRTIGVVSCDSSVFDGSNDAALEVTLLSAVATNDLQNDFPL